MSLLLLLLFLREETRVPEENPLNMFSPQSKNMHVEVEWRLMIHMLTSAGLCISKVVVKIMSFLWKPLGLTVSNCN